MQTEANPDEEVPSRAYLSKGFHIDPFTSASSSGSDVTWPLTSDSTRAAAVSILATRRPYRPSTSSQPRELKSRLSESALRICPMGLKKKQH